MNETTVPETIESTSPAFQETIAVHDYGPVIYDASNNICAAVLFGCLAICGCLAAIRIWGFRSS